MRAISLCTCGALDALVARPLNCTFGDRLGILACYTPVAYSASVFTFIESSVFERLMPIYLDDDEYAELQQYMMQNPEAGQLVRGSGGVRKLRGFGRVWASEAG